MKFVLEHADIFLKAPMMLQLASRYLSFVKIICSIFHSNIQLTSIFLFCREYPLEGYKSNLVQEVFLSNLHKGLASSS